MPGISYGYDGEGRRVVKTVGTATTVFVYDAQGQLTAEYGAATETGTDYLSVDHLGSTRLVTDGNGAVKRCYDYYPFGEDIAAGTNGRPSCYPNGFYPSGTADAVSEKFTGKERDAESGLDYFGARYMAGAQGRFASVDPVIIKKTRFTDPQLLNLYAYVRNNPFKFVDPTGGDLTIVVSGVAVGQSYVNARPGGGGPKETVPTYRVTLFNGSGSVKTTSATRDTNYNGPTSQTRGEYGKMSEAPPGSYQGQIATNGPLGFRVQVYDPKADNGSRSRLDSPEGTHRDGIAIHIGPGCSEGCALLPGGKAGLADFKDAVTKMLAEDNENGFGTGINVIFSPRNESFTLEDGLLKPQTTDEIKSREKDETQKKP